ncbi:MAG: C40 family peptidase [Pseudomonadota bacterium]
MTDALDTRTHAYRADLADSALRGRVDAERFVDGELFHVAVPVCDVRRAPDPGAMLTSQATLGDMVKVFDNDGSGWAWGQVQRDGYVGYVPIAALNRGPALANASITVPLAFAYPTPDMKVPPSYVLPAGALVHSVGEAGTFRILDDGAHVPAAAFQTNEHAAKDFVACAEEFMGAPYLWGGVTAHGLDCSGLVQTALRLIGIDAPRDSDQQARALGREVHIDAGDGKPDLQRGDLIFWDGHVGILRDAATLLHANAYHMRVFSEPLVQALERIDDGEFGQPVAVRRLSPDAPVGQDTSAPPKGATAELAHISLVGAGEASI